MSSNYSRSVGLPITSGLVGAGACYLAGGDLSKSVVSSKFGKVPVPVLIGAGCAVGLGLAEFSHDYIFKNLHVSERLAQPASLAVNTGLNFLSEYAVLELAEKGVASEIGNTKLAALALGTIVASDFMWNNFLGSYFGDDTHQTY